MQVCCVSVQTRTLGLSSGCLDVSAPWQQPVSAESDSVIPVRAGGVCPLIQPVLLFRHTRAAEPAVVV